MNATGVEGTAAKVAAGLAKRKFTIGGISNAPDSWYVTQPAVVHYGPAGLDQALLTASQIPGAKPRGRPQRHVRRWSWASQGHGALPERLKPIPSEVAVNVYNTTYKTGLAKVFRLTRSRRVGSRSRTSQTTRCRPCSSAPQ